MVAPQPTSTSQPATTKPSQGTQILLQAPVQSHDVLTQSVPSVAQPVQPPAQPVQPPLPSAQPPLPSVLPPFQGVPPPPMGVPRPPLPPSAPDTVLDNSQPYVLSGYASNVPSQSKPTSESGFNKVKFYVYIECKLLISDTNHLCIYA
jgi:hypothetical protein